MRLLMYIGVMSVEIIYVKSKLQEANIRCFYFFFLLPGTLRLKAVQTHTHMHTHKHTHKTSKKGGNVLLHFQFRDYFVYIYLLLLQLVKW